MNNQQICIEFNGSNLTIEDIVMVALQKSDVSLSQDSKFKNKINKGVVFLDNLLKEEGIIYGVTTGYGDSCSTPVPKNLIEKLPKNLYIFHSCGMGDVFTPVQTRAILAVRLTSLARGFSGVRYELLEYFILLLKNNINPRIPQEGSVGASGDLTPLSYIAAVIAGEGQVLYKNTFQDTRKNL